MPAKRAFSSEVYYVLLVQVVLEFQAIIVENANFRTKMDFFVISTSTAHNSRAIGIFATKTHGEACHISASY